MTELVPRSVFAFDVSFLGMAVATWRWEISPASHGGAVTLSAWDRRGRLMRVLGLATGVRDRRGRNQAGIQETLERTAV